MSYRWTLAPSCDDPELASVAARGWDDQARAEAWLTGFYLELSDAGVEAVTLVEEDRVVYGPMPLEA